MKPLIIIAVLFFIYSPNAFSETSALSNNSNNDALQKTMFLLNNPAAREAYIRKNSSAQQADRTLRDLAGSKQTSNEMYSLASEVFAQIAQQANGDPTKMLELIQQAQQNPEAFANSFSPEQRKKLADLAKQVKQNRK